jgi:Ran GTPase-activating protein (RanGAP) involved in mRNA processing and transport
MKLQLLNKYTELCEKSRFKFLPQIKTYLETEVEKDDQNNEIVNMPYPGNARYNFENRIDDNDMQALSITYMSFVKNIHIIDLSYNKLTDKGISILSKLIEYAENIEKINLEGNQIGDKGCEDLNKSLKEKVKLTHLNLNTNIFGNLGLMSINELLFKNPNLINLNVGGNRFDWDGIISITSALKTTNNTLQVLNIDDPAYKANDQHFFNHFGKMFLSNSGLQKLSLKLHKIRFEALNIIIYSLVNNKTLTVLDLSGNQICFQGMIYLRDYLNKNDILKSINLSGNKLRDRGIKVLGDGLKNNKTLIHLDITNNDIGDDGFSDFGNKLMENTGIKSLKLFRDNHWLNNENSIKIFDDYLKMKGKDFYPDFTIYEDEVQQLNIAYLETHIPNENDYLVV